MANLSNGKTVNNSHLKKKNILNANSMGPDESNEVLDLRKSNPDKLCFWCGKRGSLSDSGVESDFCSEVCFDQFRRDSFKKRSTCMWCNNSNHGVFNINTMSSLDETKFCSEYCLTQFKDGSMTMMNGGLASTSTATTSKSSIKSPISVASPESTVGVTDLITPDLWLKKAQIKKSPNCTVTSPFRVLSPRGSSISPPMVSPSPSIELETLPLNDTLLNTKGCGNGLGSVTLNRLPGITPLTLSNCPLSKVPSPITLGNAVVKTKCPSLGNDNSIGETMRKRSKMSSHQSPNEYSSWNNINQGVKGLNTKATNLRVGRASKVRIMEQQKSGKESPLGLGGNMKGARVPLSMGNCLPFQNSPAPRTPSKPSQILPYPQNLFMTNGHASKLNFGSLGLALSGGFGLGGFPSNFLPADENSTESSSSCSTTSQALDPKRGEFFQQRVSQRTNVRLESRESQTEFESHEADFGSQNMSSSSTMSILPPVTILVPFPVAVPIPIPIPIPVIMGSGFSMTEKTFNTFKGSSDDVSGTTEETSTSQVQVECNSTSGKRDVSTENDTDDSQINSSSTPKPVESGEGKTQTVCGLVKVEVEDSLSAAQ